MKRTEINEIGEFGIINRINSKFDKSRSTTILGIGDDAAITNTDKELIITSSDMLLEGVHFDLSYTPLKHLGYKLVVVNLSDIFSMNCHPNHILVNIAISNKFSVEAIDEIYDGIKYACDDYNIDLIGGDTTTSMSGLILSCTAIGYGDKKQICYRDKAKADDIICISGIVIRLSLISILFSSLENLTSFKSSTLTKLDKFLKGLKLINSPLSIVRFEFIVNLSFMNFILSSQTADKLIFAVPIPLICFDSMKL